MNDIVQIKYRREPGYGDIVSPICYAHNLTAYLNVPGQMNFFYHEDRAWYEHTECESASKRIEYIFNHTSKSLLDTDLTLAQIKSEEALPIKHNMIEGMKYHNWRVSDNTVGWVGDQDHVVFVNAKNNSVQFDEYPNPKRKAWKNPLSNEQWDEFESNFPNREYVDYLTPIEEAVEKLRSAKVVFTYHGSAGWLARWLGCPMIVFSDKHSLTKLSFPNAVVRTNEFQSLYDKDYLDHCINMSKKRTNHLNRQVRDMVLCAR